MQSWQSLTAMWCVNFASLINFEKLINLPFWKGVSLQKKLNVEGSCRKINIGAYFLQYIHRTFKTDNEIDLLQQINYISYMFLLCNS